MTHKQMQMAFTLEFFPFEHGSPAARFVDRMANYARYEPGAELTNEDTKELARLFDTYIAKMEKAKLS